MKYLFCSLFLAFSLMTSAQHKKPVSKRSAVIKKATPASYDLTKVNDSIPDLIPFKRQTKQGYINQRGKLLIPAVYSNVGFFTEDCQLLNSPQLQLRKYGTGEYASVRYEGKDYRIDKWGRRVYHFKDQDLGRCASEFKSQLFHAYILNNLYGIIEDAKFENPADYRQFKIYPQYQYLHILEGDDLRNPMIIAVKNDRFGIIDVNGNTVIPFEYADIKRNYSWKIGRLFEVTKDGETYFYIDTENRVY